MTDNLEEWYSKEAAAQTIGKSVKTIERLIARGEIATKHQTRRGSKPQTVCRPEDVERLRPASPAQIQLPLGHKTQAAIATRPPIHDTTTIVETLSLICERIMEQRPARLRAWLTVKEASALSGLSVSLLRQAIRNGTLTAIRDGRTWKVHKKALAEYEPEAAAHTTSTEPRRSRASG